MSFYADMFRGFMADGLLEQGFADQKEDVVYWVPERKFHERQPISGVIVSEASLEGTNEVSGDGRFPQKPMELGTRESILLNIPRRHNLPYQKTQDTTAPDGFVVRGKYYRMQRKLSADEIYDTVLAVSASVRELRSSRAKS